jgi:Arc/MetJ-type ribon-helix-helix transcriptional regulator
MRKTSVYLPEEEADQLRRVATRKGRSQADLIRDGVRRVIAEAGGERREFRSLGKGHGGGGRHEPWRADDIHDEAMGHR